jgi:hypothetical protein
VNILEVLGRNDPYFRFEVWQSAIDISSDNQWTCRRNQKFATTTIVLLIMF